MKKKVLITGISCVVVLCAALAAVLFFINREEPKAPLSDLSEEECRAFLEESGVDLALWEEGLEGEQSEVYKQHISSGQWDEHIKMCIETLEDDPYSMYYMTISSVTLPFDLIEEIRGAVRAYYEFPDPESQIAPEYKAAGKPPLSSLDKASCMKALEDSGFMEDGVNSDVIMMACDIERDPDMEYAFAEPKTIQTNDGEYTLRDIGELFEQVREAVKRYYEAD